MRFKKMTAVQELHSALIQYNSVHGMPENIEIRPDFESELFADPETKKYVRINENYVDFFMGIKLTPKHIEDKFIITPPH
jgi:hypothetical protein